MPEHEDITGVGHLHESKATLYDSSGGTIISSDGSEVFISEQAAAAADVAGDGQVWVLNSAPNRLRFTDDAGNEFKVVLGTNIATDAASLTPNCDLYELEGFSALAQALTINAPTGTPLDGQKWTFRAVDDGTGRALTWNAIYRAVGVTLPTTTTASKTLYVGFVYNSAATKWDAVAVTEEA